jgi:hypothetical protein
MSSTVEVQSKIGAVGVCLAPATRSDSAVPDLMGPSSKFYFYTVLATYSVGGTAFPLFFSHHHPILPSLPDFCQFVPTFGAYFMDYRGNIPNHRNDGYTGRGRGSTSRGGGRFGGGGYTDNFRHTSNQDRHSHSDRHSPSRSDRDRHQPRREDDTEGNLRMRLLSDVSQLLETDHHQIEQLNTQLDAAKLDAERARVQARSALAECDVLKKEKERLDNMLKFVDAQRVQMAVELDHARRAVDQAKRPTTSTSLSSLRRELNTMSSRYLRLQYHTIAVTDAFAEVLAQKLPPDSLEAALTCTRTHFKTQNTAWMTERKEIAEKEGRALSPVPPNDDTILKFNFMSFEELVAQKIEVMDSAEVKSLQDRLSDHLKPTLLKRIDGKPLAERIAATVAETSSTPNTVPSTINVPRVLLPPPEEFDWTAKGTMITVSRGQISDTKVFMDDSIHALLPTCAVEITYMLRTATIQPDVWKAIKSWYHLVYHDIDLYGGTSDWFQTSFNAMATNTDGPWVVDMVTKHREYATHRPTALDDTADPRKNDTVEGWHIWLKRSSDNINKYMASNLGYALHGTHINVRHHRGYYFLTMTRPNLDAVAGIGGKKTKGIEWWAFCIADVFYMDGYYMAEITEHNITINPNFYIRRFDLDPKKETHFSSITILQLVKFFASIGVTEAIAKDLQPFMRNLIERYKRKTDQRLWNSTTPFELQWCFDWKGLQRQNTLHGQDSPPAFPGSPEWYPPLSPDTLPVAPPDSLTGTASNNSELMQVDDDIPSPIPDETPPKRRRASTGSQDSARLKFRKIKSDSALTAEMVNSFNSDTFLGPTDAMNAILAAEESDEEPNDDTMTRD